MARKVDAHQLELAVQRPETSPPAKGEKQSRQLEQDTAARRHPAAAELLWTPGALLNRTHLRELGLERRAVDAVFHPLPVVALPGYSRPLIRARGAPRACRAPHVPRRSGAPDEIERWLRWITTRPTAGRRSRYRVMYRLGGRESMPRYAGSFATKREALARKAWVMGELAALRVPDLRLVDERSGLPMLAEIAERWQASRVDVAAGALQTYRVALGRVLPRIGDRPIDELDAQTVSDLVAELHGSASRSRRSARRSASWRWFSTMRARAAESRPRSPDGQAAAGKAPARSAADGGARRGGRPAPAPGATGSPRCSSTPPGCASGSSRLSPGATSTSRAAAGGSRRARLGDRAG